MQRLPKRIFIFLSSLNFTILLLALLVLTTITACMADEIIPLFRSINPSRVTAVRSILHLFASSDLHQSFASDDEIVKAAKMANAHDYITALPGGYQALVLEGGVNLSVGHRQLIAIARAILADPDILILDEATANIDTVTETLIQQALENVLKNRTAIIIAHRLSTIRNADLIFVIDEGKIVEQGRHEELL